MTAVSSVVAGGPHRVRIDEVPEPWPTPGQVRVPVRVCGVNYPDLLFTADRYQIRPLRYFTPGGVPSERSSAA